jgi:chromosome segregation ATPase
MDQGLTMLKNRHLLMVIAGLGGLSALLGLILVVTENQNTARIESLQRELNDERRNWTEVELRTNGKLDRLNSELVSSGDKLNRNATQADKARGDLAAQLAAANATNSRLESELLRIRKALDETHAKLRTILRSRWLAEDGRPSEEKMKAFDKFLSDLAVLLDKKP